MAFSIPNAVSTRIRSFLAVALLAMCSPLLYCMALYTWLQYVLKGSPGKKGTSSTKKYNILVTGGKMSKASAVVRAVGRDGHKVFTAEITPYTLCHTRFSKYVSRHYILPRPTEKAKEWVDTVQAIVKENDIDLIIPCTAPVESSAYAHLREQLPPHVRVFAFDGAVSDTLDNKFTFNQALKNAGLSCPETANMESTKDAVRFFEGLAERDPEQNKKYIVKPAVYDPKARTEILFLPISDKKKQNEYLASRGASPQVPYVIQEVLSAPEYGTYAVYNDGHLTAFTCFKSVASCLVYSEFYSEHSRDLLELHKGLGKSMNLTGQLTLDFMHTASGDKDLLVPIECNPRIHSAIVNFAEHPNLGKALTDPENRPENDSDVVVTTSSATKFFLMDQLFLKAGFWKSKNCFELSFAEMLSFNDAMLCGDDPLPFLAMYLVQIPSLLLLELMSGTDWSKIDFCIGKIVKQGGD